MNFGIIENRRWSLYKVIRGALLLELFDIGMIRNSINTKYSQILSSMVTSFDKDPCLLLSLWARLILLEGN